MLRKSGNAKVHISLDSSFGWIQVTRHQLDQRCLACKKNYNKMMRLVFVKICQYNYGRITVHAPAPLGPTNATRV
jgi:hypothetical protein